MNQRWNLGRTSSRPAGEPIRTQEYDVSTIEDDTTPKLFIREHHYLATLPPTRARFGLYHRGELAGVAIFSPPVRDATLAILPGSPADNYVLSRFVLLDEVPGNGETWFLGRCFAQLRAAGALGVVSFSDPFPRTSARGRVVFPGHVGTIYQAHNGVYLGRTRPDELRLLPDGSALHRRTLAKIRKLERGSSPAIGRLVAHGADRLLDGEDPGEWLDYWLPRLTRAVRHPGCHKYAWTLQRRHRRTLGTSRQYPKHEKENSNQLPRLVGIE